MSEISENLGQMQGSLGVSNTAPQLQTQILGSMEVKGGWAEYKNGNSTNVMRNSSSHLVVRQILRPYPGLLNQKLWVGLSSNLQMVLMHSHI